MRTSTRGSILISALISSITGATTSRLRRRTSSGTVCIYQRLQSANSCSWRCRMSSLWTASRGWSRIYIVTSDCRPQLRWIPCGIADLLGEVTSYTTSSSHTSYQCICNTPKQIPARVRACQLEFLSTFATQLLDERIDHICDQTVNKNHFLATNPLYREKWKQGTVRTEDSTFLLLQFER